MEDKPKTPSRTYVGLLQIGRAYQTHGKGQSWNIQTMPIWSNLDITESDYRFMSSHRRPGDEGLNADEISSKGYFCAKVTVQQSGTALRVLNAGSRKLPAGTVIICHQTKAIHRSTENLVSRPLHKYRSSVRVTGLADTWRSRYLMAGFKCPICRLVTHN